MRSSTLYLTKTRQIKVRKTTSAITSNILSKDGKVYDKALESECKKCCASEVIQEAWNTFVYRGDNAVASRYMVEQVLKPCCAKNIEFGHNENSTKYFVKWYCDMDKKHKTLEKNYLDAQKYYNQAFLGTINMSIGILFIGFMILKNQ